MKSLIRIKGEARVVRVDHHSGDHAKNGFAVLREDVNQWSLTTSHQDSDVFPDSDLNLATNTINE
jgi:hypothetical protein